MEQATYDVEVRVGRCSVHILHLSKGAAMRTARLERQRGAIVTVIEQIGEHERIVFASKPPLR